MTTLPLLELRSRWEAALAEGRDLTATELCHDCPEHAAHFESVLAQWRTLRAATGAMPTAHEDTLVGQSTPAATGDTLKRPGTVPGYEILRVLGRGGMGVVYEARQVSLNRVVALKMILAGYHAGDEELRRFLVEAEAVAAIAHPGIVQVYEYGTLNELPYLAMEYCSGGSLSDRLHQQGLTPRESARLMIDVARAMHAAHARGIMHRDLKPANILLASGGCQPPESGALRDARSSQGVNTPRSPKTQGGHTPRSPSDTLRSPKVTDFGLAKRVEGDSNLTQTGAIMGTPAYMAPEQALGKRNIGPAVDVWAMGVILYECLTGRVPFRGDSTMETMQQVMQQEPAPPRQIARRVPRDLEVICLKCLRKEPEKRYASAAELADDLQRFLDGRVIRARPVGVVERVVKWVRRQPGIAALAALVILSLLAGAVVSSLALREAQAKRRDAEAALADLKLALGQLAIGLIRPLGHQPGHQLNDIELATMEELAALPRSRDRVRHLFLDNALSDATSAEQLMRRLEPALRAAVGLDNERRRELITRLHPRLTDPETPARGKLAAAALLGRLGGANRESLLLLVDAAVTARHDADREQCMQHLDAACVWADAESAQALAEAILARMKEAARPTDAEELAVVFDRALKKLPSEESEALAARAVPVMVERLKLVRDPTAWREVHAFQIVAALLGRADAERLTGQLIDLVKQESDPYTLQALAEVFEPSAKLVSPEVAARTAEAIAFEAVKRLAAPPRRPEPLGEVVAVVGPRLRPAEAARLGRELAPVLTTTDGTASMQAAVRAAGAVLARLNADEAAVLAGHIVTLARRARSEKTLLDAVDVLTANSERLKEKDRAAHVAALAPLLQARLDEVREVVLLEPLAARIVAAARADRAAALPALVAVTARIVREVPTLTAEGCARMAPALLPAALALDEKESAALMAKIAAQVSPESTAGELWVLASGFGPIAGRVPEDTAAPVRQVLLRAIRRVAASEKRPDFQMRLALAIAAMGESLDAKEGHEVANALAMRVTASLNPRSLSDLPTAASIIKTLRPLLDAKGRAVHSTTIATALAAAATSANPQELRRLAIAYQAVMSHHPRGDRLAGAAQIASRATELFETSRRLEDQLALGDAYHHVGQWVEEASVKQASWRAALAIVRASVRQPVKADVVEDIELPLAQLSDEQLVELLKQPSCVWAAETAVRRTLERRHQLTFADVWQVAAWAEQRGMREVLQAPAAIPVMLPQL